MRRYIHLILTCVCVGGGMWVHTYLFKVLNGVLVWDVALVWRGRGSATVGGGSREAIDETATVVVAL